MSLSTRHVRSKFLVLGALLGVVGWLGCATSNGDPADAVVPTPSPTTRTPATSPNEGDRPEFEAGFVEDAANPDSAPDGGVTCEDKNDPGSSENTPKVLPDTSDAQNAPLTVSGVLNGPVDTDFYKLNVADTLGHLLEPDTQLKTSGVEMCVFVKCPTGDSSNVACSGGSVPKKSEIGTDGCCATGASAATPTWNCSGTNDGAVLYFRVKQTANKCSPYSFTYAF